MVFVGYRENISGRLSFKLIESTFTKIGQTLSSSPLYRQLLVQSRYREELLLI